MIDEKMKKLSIFFSGGDIDVAKEKIGKLEKLEKIGIFKDQKMIIGGEIFYNRFTESKEDYQEGSELKIIYVKRDNGLVGYILDVAINLGFKIPKKYNYVIHTKLCK